MERNIDSILDTGGRQLTPDDRQFVTTLYKELEQFQFQAPKDRALMFHPLGGYQRYLIHKVTEIFPKLTSFSIGDENDRRTVVCFKSKRKEQQLQQAQALASSPERGRGSYKPSPGGRSRESSRGRAKSSDRGSKNKNKKSDPAYLPRPLRKKNPNSMPRSRSLHASPNRENSHEPYHTDDDGKRKKKRDAPLSRSASMRDARNSRWSSEAKSPPDGHRKSKTLPKSNTRQSLERRGQGLQLEGKVVNGDVEDPYNNDSDVHEHRNDADAIRQHKQQKRPSSRTSLRKEKPHSKTEPNKKHEKVTRAEVIPHRNKDDDLPDLSPSRLTDSEEDNYVEPKRPSSDSRRPKDKRPSKSRESSAKRKSRKDRNESPHLSDAKPHKSLPTNGYVDEYLPDSPEALENDYLSLDDGVPMEDNVPPSYQNTVSPAERNLNRIKRSDSNRSGSSSRSKTPVREVEPKKTPKHESKRKKSKDVVDAPVETPRKKSVSDADTVKAKDGRRGSIKGKSPKKKKSKDEKKKAAEVLSEPPKTEEHKKKKAPVDPILPKSNENLLASTDTMYMPLPTTTVAPALSAAPEENLYVNQPRCDSEVQTEMTGTLSRNKPKSQPTSDDISQISSPQQTSTSTQPSVGSFASPPQSTSADPAKFVEDFCKMMLNFQNMALNKGKEEKPAAPSSQYPDATLINNPFANFYPGAQSGNQAVPPHNLYSQFPPHISYQLYMSWMAAYYAGATGSLPPPPPMASYPSMPEEKEGHPRYEYRNLNSVFNPQFSRDGYSSSAHPSPQKEPFQPYDNNMYSNNFSSSPAQRKNESYSGDMYDYRSQSPFENLASVSVSSNHDGHKSGSERHSNSRSNSRPHSKKSESNSTIASARMNVIDSLPTHNDGADTDASSITSSSTKPEVAVQSGPKENEMENGIGSSNDERNDEPMMNGKNEEVITPPPSYDYYNYTANKDVYSSDPYNRIAEIYDFDPGFKDANIVPHFTQYNGFKLWWVDDTHALGVFTSVGDHNDAISRDISNMKIRPISEASTNSKKKAKIRVEDFGEKVSTEPRPKTNASVAKRMITNALGGVKSSKNSTGSLKQPKKKTEKQQRRKSNTN